MTQFAISDEVAADLTAKAVANECSTDDLLRSMLFVLESDEGMTERILTPELRARIAVDLQREKSEFMTSEQVDAKFEALFRELESQ